MQTRVIVDDKGLPVFRIDASAAPISGEDVKSALEDCHDPHAPEVCAAEAGQTPGQARLGGKRSRRRRFSG